MTTHTLPLAVPSRPSTLREIWDYRELLRHLTIRGLQVKYKRSALGFVWTLINPLLTVGALVGVFGYVVRIDLPSYWAFLVSGYFVWSFASTVMMAATRALNEHAALARSVRVPEHVFVLAAVGSRFVEFLLEVGLVVLALVVFHHGGIPASLLLLPVLLACQVLLVTGLALPIATLSAFFDDVQHALPVLLLVLFYLTPVFYPASMVPEQVRGLYLLNPLAHLFTAFQIVLYEGRMPPIQPLLVVAVASGAICLVGFWIFNRKRAVYAEIL